MQFTNLRDEHGQPLCRAFHAARITERSMDELIGVCKGVVADGYVHQSEAEYILKWLNSNRSVAHEWPANVITARIKDFLADGRLDEEERRELHELLAEATGEAKLRHVAENKATGLPFDTPQPDLAFEGRSFCFTGKFVYGTRAQCEREILALGGQVAGGVSQRTNYVVIGLLGSRDWLHSTHGTKIMSAVQLRERGLSISIISEDHWAEQIVCACG